MSVKEKTTANLLDDICSKGIFLKQAFSKGLAKNNACPSNKAELISGLNKIEQNCKALIKLLTDSE